ncbi:HlyU family transcriptional regulator [Enterovirga rhinocerotis]|uniref:Transcriptional activator HlyU n=1 Tax=Enterovirga rhinocerotis TaxID=1339210 RepID=A0A4R7CD06_9HYPH|nr:HlyU family transcriptional regulator [Enterovirga rhinocerotis]TDR94707.1 hypothetical protein EV668_1995 [Enterovirga rhinocerotis]
MSFWKRIFGGGADDKEPGAPTTTAEVEHNGFTILAQPYKAEGGYQTAGLVTKGEGEARREHRFVRADRFPSLDDATEFSLRKGRQLVDEQGERMFR